MTDRLSDKHCCSNPTRMTGHLQRGEKCYMLSGCHTLVCKTTDDIHLYTLVDMVLRGCSSTSLWSRILLPLGIIRTFYPNDFCLIEICSTNLLWLSQNNLVYVQVNITEIVGNEAQIGLSSLKLCDISALTKRSTLGSE